ncbi:MAG: leucyl aminopeptidase family protein [Beijerinckiaceae bacterium]
MATSDAMIIASAPSPARLWLVTPANYGTVLEKLTALQKRHLKAIGYEPKAGKLALLPSDDDRPACAVFGIGDASARDYDPFLLGRLPKELPTGAYTFGEPPPDMGTAALAWAMGAYAFSRYKPAPEMARLVVADLVLRERAELIAGAVAFGRDLINTPANDMTPSALAEEAMALAKSHKAKARGIVGKALLSKNFPLIHAVGRASVEEPRLIDFTWGDARHPKVTLVGKGVCFDTGGLDIKPSSAMLLMKKDMGGAATALAAARMIMGAKLKVRLRVLVPIVENAISGNSFRASDVIRARNGLSVEIGNTDAEGRLILADALAFACEEKPDLLIDYATLTGAARVALGPDLPPFYTTDETLAAEIAAAGAAVQDPVWRLPLWPAYDKFLDSKVADLSSTGSGGMAGSITAAMFLRRFVDASVSHAHFDIYGWTPAAKPGRPEGGEPQGARLTLALLEKRYG